MEYCVVMSNDFFEEKTYYWEYSFDLVISMLERYYDSDNPKNAYREIGRYLIQNGFNNKDDKQGSCYFTSDQFKRLSAEEIIKRIHHVFPWYSICVRKEALTIKSEYVYSNEDYRSNLMSTEAYQKQLHEYMVKKGLIEPEITIKERQINKLKKSAHR